MRVDVSSSKPPGTETVITNISSLTLLLSAAILLTAVCRFLKRCWKKLRRKRKQKHDVIAFKQIKTIPQLRRCSSTSKLTRQQYSIVPDDDIPLSTEDVTVQPELRHDEEVPTRPRAPTDPGVRSVSRQISAPVPLTHRGSIQRWTSHVDIKPFHLDPKLYKKEASLQKFQSLSKKKCGMLDTEVDFDAKAMQLKVRVNCIEQLLSKDYIHAMNTYVTVKKIPDNEIRRTSVHTKSIDPVYNQDFTFHINSKDDVSSHVVIYELYHMDRFSTSYLRAEARLPLFQIDLRSPRRLLIPFIECRKSLLTTLHPAYRTADTGCILVSLRYQPWKDTIVVNPIGVRNIPKKRYGAYGKDVYIKVVLRHRGTRLLKMKTQSAEMEKMPHSNEYYQARFNEPIQLDIKSTPVEESDITISLNHYLFLKSSFIIGQVRLSTTEQGYEANHVQSMIDSPGEQISVWYEMRGFPSSTAIEEIK